ncbi:hypothetical protein CS0771_19290 [Catellatospora sp. IY07-71]|nr:hypothetical protein CS0771_19290 [Catellatospora sp. IY07-71]
MDACLRLALLEAAYTDDFVGRVRDRPVAELRARHVTVSEWPG